MIIRPYLFALLLGLVSGWVFAAERPQLALFYGTKPPLNELRAFDWVVLDSDHAYPTQPSRTQWFAYVSVGEIEPHRSYAKTIPSTWKIGSNKEWGGAVVDQRNPEWQNFFLDKIVEPLWKKGFRGFFLDTLDSYQLATKTSQDRKNQEDGLVQLIQALHQRHPDAKLIFNRGFEVLPRVKDSVTAVVAESLFGAWNQARKRYEPVPEEDRKWLTDKLHWVQNDLNLPVYVIDYAPPGKKQLARDYAQKIIASGFEPYITNGALDRVGMGRLEIIPRRILMLYDDPKDQDVSLSLAARLAATPLNYFGYAVEYHHIQDPLPTDIGPDRYAGIVSWMVGGQDTLPSRWTNWFRQERDLGIPIVFFDSLNGIIGDAANWSLKTQARRPGRQTVKIIQRSPNIGFEMAPYPGTKDFAPLQITQGDSWLTLQDNLGNKIDAAGITPWGGYVLAPFGVVELPSQNEDDVQSRWVINPFEFLKAALRITPAPIPDPTTESGRRVFMVHVDGDGFPSKGEFPGSPYSGQVLLKEILQRFRVPSTISVIQAEVAPNGLYPEQSPALEAVARSIFAVPWVETASHSFSHPFRWYEAEDTDKTGGEGDYSLKIKGYKFNLTTEVDGSVAYINSRLAPKNKPVKVFLWTGDCTPREDAIRRTEELGLYNMNSGDTLISRSNPSVTAVAPLSINKNGALQIFAPNQNENVYTNEWTGPYYGFEKVIETFQMTETPRRLKPIDIYYHFYSATKPASLNALKKVYTWALSQPTIPQYVSQYVRQVRDFENVVIAKTEKGFRLRGFEDLRNVRLPASLNVDLVQSPAVAGIAPGPAGDYAILTRPDTDLVVGTPSPLPQLTGANGQITRWERQGRNFSLSLSGNVDLEWSIKADNSCHFTANGAPISPVRTTGNTRLFRWHSHDLRSFDARC